MSDTVAFSKDAANVFFHILTQCNLKCRHCYINPEQHGTQQLSLATIEIWLERLIKRNPAANLVLLGGEPTLHPDLAAIVQAARRLAYRSITIDTNGYLFNDILDRVTPDEVDFFSFSLDGATAATNDAIRGPGSFKACTTGIAKTKTRGFRTSLIYTVSLLNLDELKAMPALLTQLGIDRFFIQVIGLRGRSAESKGQAGLALQVTREQWQRKVLPIAQKVAQAGVPVSYPKVYLSPQESFACAGKVADNYFVFPNGRVYRCPLCEDYPLHSLAFVENNLQATAKINERDLFELSIEEGCVMNKLVQPDNLVYDSDGHALFQVACCLLKDEFLP